MTPHLTSPKTYFIVFLILLALLALTVLASGTEHKLLNSVLAVTIAVSKAVLIMLYFMHLRDSSQLTRVFAMAGFLWLAILLGLTLSDYQTRSWTPTDPLESTRPIDPLRELGPSS
jgi:cytochrome c oxidase subunit IV